jgi:hypothetical protein
MIFAELVIRLIINWLYRAEIVWNTRTNNRYCIYREGLGWVDSGPPLNANIRISCMSAFGGPLDLHTPLVFVAVHASGVTFSGFRAL